MNYFLMAVIGLLAGFILSDTFFSDDIPQQPAIRDIISPLDQSDLDATVREMIAARDSLEALLKTERSNFEALSERIDNIAYQLEENLSQPITSEETNGRRNNREVRNAGSDAEALVTAGLTRVEADRVLELENEARLAIEELLNSPEDRNRNAARETITSYQDQIRSELGDYGYEIYLTAAGQATSVPVAQIEPESAGAIAGLQEGDQIISYAGERMFALRDLQSATQAGTEGETVLLEVIRDDQTQTLVIPRGEIGISTRNRR